VTRLSWFRWATRPERRSAPDDAVLACPIRGSAVDIEECFQCGNLLAIAGGTDRPRVTCVFFGRDTRPDGIVSY
jgi:hypothetical protein